MWLFNAWQGLRFRMAVSFGLLAMLIALSVQAYVNQHIFQHAMEERAETLTAMARAVAVQIAEDVEQRQSEVSYAAAMPAIIGDHWSPAQLKPLLLELKRSFKEYAWIGFADLTGQVIVSDSGVLEGESVGQRPWFSKAQKGFFIGDLHEAKLLATHLRTQYGDEPARLVDFAAPVRDSSGLLRGVIGAHAHWRWAKDLIRRTQEAGLVAPGVDLVIAQANGQVIYPEQEFGASMAEVLSALDAGGAAEYHYQSQQYFFASAVVKTGLEQAQLGWRVLVRQRSDDVLAAPRAVARGLWMIWALGVIGTAVFAYVTATFISRPIEDLAGNVRSHQPLDSRATSSLTHTREIIDLVEAIKERDQELGRQRDELADNAQSLERRVAERTAELNAANEELRRVASTDALTGLNNRGHINTRLAQEFLRFVRHQHPYSVLLLDIDHFKRVNDLHGHAEGDRVLVGVAKVLRQSIRVSDFVGRFGGEEFLALLPNTTAGAAVAVAEKLGEAIRQADFGQIGPITVSIGVAEVHKHDVQYEDAVRRADAALYEAKHAGRDRVWLG